MKKIFISHSTSDKEIVDIFIDKILILGLNLEVKEIACTSREDTGVKSGEDIRDFIKENITNCEYVLFMISDNYKKSEICLNEMGAAWATNRNVKAIIFPNIGFESIGWLYNIKRGIKLNDSAGLDSLYEEISEISKTKSRVSTWNKQKAEFLDFINNTLNSKILETSLFFDKEKEIEKGTEELDLLDYREKYDENMENHQNSLNKISEALGKNTDSTNKGSKNLQRINESPNRSPSQIRNVMLKMALENNSLADVFDEESPKIRLAFDEAIQAAINIRKIVILDKDKVESEYQSIKGLIDSMEESLHSSSAYRKTIEENKVRLEKNYEKSKKRLLGCLSEFIKITEENINKANELLLYT